MSENILEISNLSKYFGGLAAVSDCSLKVKKGTINVRLTKSQLSLRRKKWKAKKSSFGSGTLWKYAQTVGPAYLGAPTHPGKKKEVKEYSKI